MWIKICGLSTKAAVEAAVKAGATHVGFVFAPSKRQVTIDEATQLANLVPSSIKKVGLFVNAPLSEVEKTVRQVGLDLVQLHGDETRAYIQQLSVPVIKAIPIKNGKLPENLRDYLGNIILLDAPATQFAGGNGQSFDWQSIDLLRLNDFQYFVAGGLTPENVTLAIEMLSPTGVDVSSGVETENKKDLNKIQEFIRKARETNV
ncbi:MULTISPECIES: phosphoribosylanthranilate isomerase [unclassified Enterococcus]|uniref:phosphoribosylanthranilate isomerase n=1 Tax=unclassified Enterococcus TaxID=2608891 RepID=UPI001554A236|nr:MULTISPECIES: phosphoribosylanthranilate isomerase [unclassified Enterococcus]MBS7577419.1 phosphoribosylanthranilate isomerase [Enterococcus sp. MMGLQ5-2]MBS7584826.1 phosphoribosylanthranilate isomerase [Enterococcus sp. MMGLQ5-1]NPD12681.1 phosphoribosylanthranilate isomerase [Enterococcus sp. MMGLQ5-1]NPD37253.1 phosphoribosylanthranilate isomerase [Enterococcus sp. MMGLQ5-2]